MSESQNLFTALRQSADPDVVSAIEALVRDAPDRCLNRINALAFAEKRGLDEERVIAAFLHAARVGLFELSWNVLCPGCGGVLDAGTSLKSVRQAEYSCALCAAGYEPTLDEMVEVTFTVMPRLRRIAAHSPQDLPAVEYYRQIFWGSGIDLPDDDFAQSIDVKGEPVDVAQSLSIIYNREHAPTATLAMQPGPLHLALDNRTGARLVPGVYIAGKAMHDMLGKRRAFLTAKRLLTNQTFREIYRTSTLDVDQRLKITSLTFLFTDLKGSTDLYERVGDLVAFDIVKEHFRILHEIIAAESGAVVKTIGDAVMATFSTPDRALAAALRIREAMRVLNEKRNNEDLLLKIGIHEGPCLAVTFNDRQDYFGQTVNIAARVQGLAVSRAILATGSVVDHPEALELLEADGIRPLARRLPVRGVTTELAVYEIP